VPVEESLGALKATQDAGKIRHVGLSEVTVAEIERAKRVVPIVSIQNRYNITDRDSEDALNYCEKEKMGFIPWAPIDGSGSRSLSKPGNPLEAEAKRLNVSVVQLALAWLLQKNRRSCCQSRAHHHSRISKKTWLRRNSSSARRSGRGSKIWRGRVEGVSF
jgi:aryl-alcohol dehydrogenase-like predicted oxidoreductase